MMASVIGRVRDKQFYDVLVDCRRMYLWFVMERH